VSFKPSPANIFKRPNDPRLGNQLVELEASDFVLLGYPDDEGVKNNGGRIGAAAGPEALREILFKTTVDTSAKIYDHGNLDITNIETIKKRHAVSIETLKGFYSSGKKILSIGGGHDYGYPDTYAFCDSFADKKPIVINFDAHLDLRPVEEKISSGTPFYRLLEEKQIDLVEVGLLKVCNQKSHHDYLISKGGKAIFYEDLVLEGKTLVEKFIEIMGEEIIKTRTCFLSVDIDVFSSAYAPGCSQSWPFSMQPHEFFPLLQLLLRRWDVKGMGIYEFAPNLDENFKTARLASQIAHNFLFPQLSY